MPEASTSGPPEARPSGVKRIVAPGGPAVAPPSRQGFGHKVVERVAARALDGSVSLTFAPTGLQWSLRIPGTFVLSERPANRSEMPKFF